MEDEYQEIETGTIFETDSPSIVEDNYEPDGFEQDDIVGNEPQDYDEDAIEPQGEEFEEWEYPEFISDDYVVPEEFESPKAELSWYKDKYVELMDMYRSDDFTSKLTQTHQQILTKNEETFEKFKAFEAMTNGDPAVAIKLYAPEFLAANGQSHILTNEEKSNYIDKQLQKEYGKNYQQHYDPLEAADPDSISGRMFARQQQIQEAIELAANDAAEQGNAVIPETYEQSLEREYTGFSEAMTREEFNDFAAEATEYFQQNPMTMKDVYLLRNIDDIADEIYNKGIADGRNNAADTFKNYGREVSHSQNERTYKPENSGHVINSHDVYNYLRT